MEKCLTCAMCYVSLSDRERHIVSWNVNDSYLYKLVIDHLKFAYKDGKHNSLVNPSTHPPSTH